MSEYLIFHFFFGRKLASTKRSDNSALKCAIDHILDAEQKGEINEDNVLYIVENINVAGIYKSLYFPFDCIKWKKKIQTLKIILI